jgi:indole-3-glycerol phosphate synthase
MHRRKRFWIPRIVFAPLRLCAFALSSVEMKAEISPTLSRILADTRREIELDKSRTSVKRLKQMLRDAVPLISFASALAPGNALIAELKERSPSQGKMRPQNVADAPNAYKKSHVVKALSVLTSWTHFGSNMRVEMMEAVKKQTAKPVLRKDFIIEEYQIYQARAYGADAILLMANILGSDEMRRLSDLAFELGMDVLFETHSAAELEELPKTARIIGINRRTFEGGARSFKIARFFRQWLGAKRDRSIDPTRFEYAEKLPASVIKVAESGVAADECPAVFALGFHSILVGTSLLMDPRGITAALHNFESAIQGLEPKARPGNPSLHPAST